MHTSGNSSHTGSIRQSQPRICSVAEISSLCSRPRPNVSPLSIYVYKRIRIMTADHLKHSNKVIEIFFSHKIRVLKASSSNLSLSKTWQIIIYKLMNINKYLPQIIVKLKGHLPGQQNVVTGRIHCHSVSLNNKPRG